MAIVLAVFYSLIFTPITTAAIPGRGRPRRLIMELINRDSIRSPYHNLNENATNRIARAMNSSTARFAYLQAKIKSNSANNIDYQLDVLPSMNSSLFYVNFSIGQPPIPQFAVMDTGSSLLWVQCHPCFNCSKQFGPIFDPSESSSYANLSCFSSYCRYSPGRRKCNFFNQCAYNQTYLRGPSSTGILATEQIVFKTSDEGKILVPDIVFGCSHNNGNFPDRQLSGVFGLGFSRSSPVSQLDSSFSYCIGNLFDPYYVHNKLILGHGARIEGDATPLEVIAGHYFITLEAISVDGRKLDINPNVFRRKTLDKDGVIIDTGSPITWLVKAGYEALHDEVQSLLDIWLTRYLPSSSSLCYRGTASQDLVGFPAVTFHFAGGAELVLDVESLFVQVWPDIFCMAVFPSFVNGDNYANLSLIGMMAQQNYNVAYDIDGKKLTFQRIDCELLDD